MTDESSPVYQFLVVDSGPIIRLTGTSALWRRAKSYYTVPAVLQEIRDARARHHLEQLPFELIPKEPSAEGIRAIVQFSKQTGDFNSLSAVDIQVLGLLYDLELEGCRGDMSHVRTKPKRMVGGGKVEYMKKRTNPKQEGSAKKEVTDETAEPLNENSVVVSENEEHDDESEGETSSDDDSISEDEEVADSSEKEQLPPTCWAALFDKTASAPVIADDESPTLEPASTMDQLDQFGDAENDLLVTPTQAVDTYDVVDGETSAKFPSLAESMALAKMEPEEEPLDDEERKKRSLQPVSKSGKTYNSFKKYGHLMKPAPKQPTQKPIEAKAIRNPQPKQAEVGESRDLTKSRILGGGALAGQGEDVADDGQGWVTTTSEINAMKSAGILQPHRTPEDVNLSTKALPQGPPIEDRAAVATTDFAMQNVVLQMNLELLSVDGIKIRKMKSWVLRCGACFKVHTNADGTGPIAKRLFCGHCGSDMMQRIAASVDGKNGRLRLHMKKNYRHNLRGTKFSLPKPGKGNRFQGDLLLREDQLLVGAWNQKARIRSGKARHDAQSMFGRDLAGNVGCHAQAATTDDIRVGFGRRNPNAAKGRERRGKKKKSSDKACGLRRY